MFRYVSLEKRIPQDHPLRLVREMVDGDYMNVPRMRSPRLMSGRGAEVMALRR